MGFSGDSGSFPGAWVWDRHASLLTGRILGSHVSVMAVKSSFESDGIVNWHDRASASIFKIIIKFKRNNNQVR